MIHGDIDLTKNLDFYRNKKKKSKIITSLIPWKKDHNVEYRNLDNYIVSYNSNWITYNGNGTSTIDYPGAVTYNLNTGTISYSTAPDYTISTVITTTPDITYREYNILSYGNGFNDYYWLDSEGSWNNLYISTNDVGTGTLNYHSITNDKSKKKKKPSIFGERKDRSIEMIRHFNHCNNSTILGYCKCHKCKSHMKLGEYYYDDLIYRFIKRKPSDDVSYYAEEARYRFVRGNFLEEPNHTWRRRYIDALANLSGSSGHTERRIPWLRKLHTRIYEDYIKDLHEVQDYSSYLTNMGWLGIH